MAKKSAEDMKEEDKKEEVPKEEKAKKEMPEKDDKKEEKVVSKGQVGPEGKCLNCGIGLDEGERIISNKEGHFCSSKCEDEFMSTNKSVSKAPTETDEDDEDLSDMNEDEKKSYAALKSKVKKKLLKSGNSVNPQESAEQSESAEHTTKSVKMNLEKSPLYVSLSKQLENMEKAWDSKISALEKSQNDRLDNIKKGMAEIKATEEKMEKFYKQPLYKSAVDAMGPEAVKVGSIQEQKEAGKVRYRN